MDSSALEVLILPACHAIVIGLAGGFFIHTLIECLDRLIVRGGESADDNPGTGPWDP